MGKGVALASLHWNARVYQSHTTLQRNTFVDHLFNGLQWDLQEKRDDGKHEWLDMEIQTVHNNIHLRVLNREAKWLSGDPPHPSKFRVPPFLGEINTLSDARARIRGFETRLLQIHNNERDCRNDLFVMMSVWNRAGYPSDWISHSWSKHLKNPSLARMSREWVGECL